LDEKLVKAFDEERGTQKKRETKEKVIRNYKQNVYKFVEK